MSDNGLVLDSGYLSRLLRALEDDGLVRVEVSASDRHIRMARLTAAGPGLAEHAGLQAMQRLLRTALTGVKSEGQTVGVLDLTNA